MTLSFLTLRVLWIASLVGYGLLLARLFHVRLHRTYKGFTLYLMVEIAQSLVLLPVAPRSNWYFRVYAASQAVVCLLYILVLLELYTLVFQEYPGIARTGRYAVGAGLAIALLISLLLSYPRFFNPAEKFPALLVYNNAERLIVFALLLFILILNGLLACLPVPLNRNTLLYSAGFAVYFMAKVMAQVVRAVTGHQATRNLGAVMLIVSMLCTLLWTLLLRPQEKSRPLGPGRPWREAGKERLSARMLELNGLLARSARQNERPSSI